MKNMYRFSKDDIQSTAGAGVLMMLFYFLFSASSILEQLNINFFPLKGDAVIKLAGASASSVSLFFFLFSYIMTEKTVHVRKRERDTDKIWPDIMYQFWSRYAFLYCITFFCAVIFTRQSASSIYGFDKVTPVYILLDFFGLSGLFSTPTLNSTWTMVAFVYFLITAIPCFARVFWRKIDTVCIAVALVLPFLGLEKGSVFFTYIFTVLFAVLAVRHNVVGYIKTKFNSVKGIMFLYVILACISVILLYARVKIPAMIYLVDPVFSVCICIFVSSIPIKKIKHGMAFIGKYSLSILLIGRLVINTYLTEWIYSFHNFIAVWLGAVLICLGISIVAECGRKRLRNIINIKAIIRFCGKNI